MKPLILSAALTFLVMSCATSSEPNLSDHRYDAAEVINKTWQWQGTVTPVEKITVQHPENYTLKLAENGLAEFRFDCNRGGADYQISDSKLSFGHMMSTRMACPEGSLDSVYMKQLQEVTLFFIKNNDLYLDMPADSGTLHFKEQALRQ